MITDHETLAGQSTKRRAIYVAFLAPVLYAAAEHFASFGYYFFPEQWHYSGVRLQLQLPHVANFVLAEVFGIALLYGALAGLSRNERPSMSFLPASLAWYAGGIVLGVGYAAFTKFLVDSYRLVGIHGRSVFTVFAHPGSVVATLIVLDVALISPIVQEMVFRGWLFSGLRKALSFWPSALVSSAIFAVFHFSLGLPALTHSFLFGLLAAALYERSKSLIPSIVFHVVVNTIAAGFWLLASTR